MSVRNAPDWIWRPGASGRQWPRFRQIFRDNIDRTRRFDRVWRLWCSKWSVVEEGGGWLILIWQRLWNVASQQCCSHHSFEKLPLPLSAFSGQPRHWPSGPLAGILISRVTPVISASKPSSSSSLSKPSSSSLSTVGGLVVIPKRNQIKTACPVFAWYLQIGWEGHKSWPPESTLVFYCLL